MKMQQYKITLTGQTPLLLHQDNYEWREIMKKWELDSGNKAKSVAGDDRSPAWRWMGGLYVERGLIVVPSDNLMTLLREGGKRCMTGKGKTTFKSQTQSGIVVDQSSWPVLVDGHTISTDEIEKLKTEENFSVHMETVSKLGFSLFCKSARVGQSKHLRVRARFDRWSLTGTMTVLDEQITESVMKDILRNGGAYSGLCDWRPSSPRAPGSFGKFLAEVEAI